MTRLEELAALAAEAGADAVALEARGFAERVADRRLYVACVGQFKRGKSTLLNALVGEAVLPTDVVPVTSVVTVLRAGERGARVRTREGSWRDVDPGSLADYVTETGNPSNAKGIAGTEVFLPAPLLQGGVCLVDTPGLGSVFALAGEATRAFLPHIDAALVVLGGDPPITGEEAALVETLASRIDDVALVLNKADKLTDAERTRVRTFTEGVLRDRLGSLPAPALEVSAAERLAGTGPPRDWDALTAWIRGLGEGTDGGRIRGIEDRGVRFAAERLLAELDERERALSRPLEETERRIAALRACAEEASRSLGDLSHLLDAQRNRLRDGFVERREAFLARALPAARAELAERLRDAPERRGSALRRRGLSLAREIYHRWVDEWKRTEDPAGEAMYREGARRFVELAREFLDRLSASGTPVPADLPLPPDEEAGFRVRSRFHATEMLAFTSTSPLDCLGDLVLPRRAALARIERGVGAYLSRLLSTNAARVTGDLDERVRQSRRRLEADVRAALAGIVASAERARDEARRRSAAGRPEVEAELQRLAEWKRRTLALRDAGGNR